MAIDTNFASSAAAPNAFTYDEDESFQATWTKMTFMLDFTTIAVFIVGSVSVVMAIAYSTRRAARRRTQAVSGLICSTSLHRA